MESITEPIENRINYIKNHKPDAELRLRLLKSVASPNIISTAWAEYEKVERPALAEYEKVKRTALAEYEKVKRTAWAEYEKVKRTAWAEYEKVVRDLHRKECFNCPWAMVKVRKP